jgi:hypothetical protein
MDKQFAASQESVNEENLPHRSSSLNRGGGKTTENIKLLNRNKDISDVEAGRNQKSNTWSPAGPSKGAGGGGYNTWKGAGPDGAPFSPGDNSTIIK